MTAEHVAIYWGEGGALRSDFSGSPREAVRMICCVALDRHGPFSWLQRSIPPFLRNWRRGRMFVLPPIFGKCCIVSHDIAKQASSLFVCLLLYGQVHESQNRLDVRCVFMWYAVREHIRKYRRRLGSSTLQHFTLYLNTAPHRLAC